MNARRVPVLALLLVTAGLATAATLPDPMVDHHAHADPALHRLAAGDLAAVGALDPPRVAADPFVAVRGTGAPGLEAASEAGGAYFGEVDARGDHVYLAQLKPPAAVHVLDVSDPAAPREVGKWRVPSGSGGVTDVKVSLDGRHVYAAYQGGFGDPNNGIFTLDVTDPTSPRSVHHWAVAAGVHMILVWEGLGKEWVIAPTATAGGGAPIALAYDDVLTGERVLSQVAVALNGHSPHDVWVYHDSILDVPLLVVANGGGGVAVIPFPVPAAPHVVAGQWSYEGSPRFYAHTIRAAVQDGKRYLIVSPEGGALGLGVNEVAKLWVLDATDLRDIKVAGSWGNPGNHVSQVFLHSTHNFQLVDGTVYLAHNHGGVWILDASALPALEAVAYRLPAEHATTSTPGGSLIQDSIPAVWDVVVKEGLVYAADRSGGLYVMHYGPDVIGPEGPTSYG